MSRARRGVDEGDGLAGQFAAPDDPVQRVLERARHAMRVLRAGNQHSRAGVKFGPELRDGRGWLIAVKVGVEQREFRELGVDPNLDTVRRQSRGGMDERRVRREAPETPGNREHAERLTPSLDGH